MTVEQLQATIADMQKQMARAGANSPNITLELSATSWTNARPAFTIMAKHRDQYVMLHSAYSGTIAEQLADGQKFVDAYVGNTHQLAECLGIAS